jgi:pimeloyl-ACP methyl ester carboxylesterase
MRACRFSRTPSRSCERGCHDPDGSCHDSREPAVLSGLAAYTGPAMVLYGEYDIFGTSADVVRRRLPHAVQVTLSDSGHLHWQQNQARLPRCFAPLLLCAPAVRCLIPTGTWPEAPVTPAFAAGRGSAAFCLLVTEYPQPWALG